MDGFKGKPQEANYMPGWGPECEQHPFKNVSKSAKISFVHFLLLGWVLGWTFHGDSCISVPVAPSIAAPARPRVGKSQLFEATLLSFV